jgi:hypothetical protein
MGAGQERKWLEGVDRRRSSSSTDSTCQPRSVIRKAACTSGSYDGSRSAGSGILGTKSPCACAIAVRQLTWARARW